MNKTLELFYKFLHDNNALVAWEKNFMVQRTLEEGLTRAEFIHRIFQTNDAQNLIMAAFRWDRTPEGFDYWSKLRNKWWSRYSATTSALGRSGIRLPKKKLNN